MTLTFQLPFVESDYSKSDLTETLEDGTPNPDFIKTRFDVDNNGNFVATTIVCKPAPFNPTAKMPDGFVSGIRALTDEEKSGR